MAKIRNKDTKPEVYFRRLLFADGYRYRKNVSAVTGHPDLYLARYRTAIFVNGCFWHRCPHCALPLPKSNVEFWTQKFRRNVSRDERDALLLVEAGWTVLVVWECHLKKDRFAGTMADLVRQVRLSESLGKRERGRYVEVGAIDPWKLAMARRRARGHLRR